jgi:hypothetical protein
VAFLRSRLASVDAMPVALVAALAAVVVLVAAFLIGLATAPTREHVNRAEQEAAPARPAALPLLGAVAPLPAAPPARKAVRVRVARHRPAPAPHRPPAAPIPKLLSGTG